MGEVITNKELKRKIAIEKARRKAVEGLEWLNEHREGVAAAAGVAVAGIKGCIKLIDRYKTATMIYDPTLHKNVKLKKRLSKRALKEINLRYENGESLHHIYQDMGII